MSGLTLVSFATEGRRRATDTCVCWLTVPYDEGNGLWNHHPINPVSTRAR